METTLKDFFQKYNGKQVEFDGKYEFQCVDLVQMYNKECVGAPAWNGDAKDYKNNPRPAFYSYQANTLLYIPPQGAIAVWSEKVGDGHGHVGIVTSANLMSFVSFDQNWPTGSPAILVNHNYKNVVGFLVPRSQDFQSAYNLLVTDLRALVNKYPLLS